MLDDQPHMYFMHFWAQDDAVTLAKTLRRALDKANVKKTGEETARVPGR
jgi:hypothetical protein